MGSSKTTAAVVAVSPAAAVIGKAIECEGKVDDDDHDSSKRDRK